MPESSSLQALKATVKEQQARLLALEQYKSRAHLLLAAIEQSGEGICLVDLNRVITFVNPAFAAMHGYRAEQLLGQELSIFHNAEQMPAVERALNTIMETGQFVGELWHAKRDGSIFPASMKNALLLDESQKPIGIIGTMHDITNHLRAEYAIQESEARYRNLVENTTDLITQVNHQGLLSFTNHTASKVFGIAPQNCTGLPAFQFVHPADRERTRAWFFECIRQKKSQATIENRQVNQQTGEVAHMLWATQFHYDQKGNCLWVGGMAKDITPFKKVEERLRRNKQELEAEIAERASELSQKNIAMREILGQLEYEKNLLAATVNLNVEKLLLPIIGKLKRKGGAVSQHFLEIMEHNIKELTSSFGQSISTPAFSLTPKEIEICNLIKKGFTGKEIASMLNLSLKTIESHRYKIRKKLAISTKKINLASFLKNL